MAELPVKKITGRGKKPLSKKGSVSLLKITTPKSKKSTVAKKNILKKNDGVVIPLKSPRVSSKISVQINDNTTKIKKVALKPKAKETKISKNVPRLHRRLIPTFNFSRVSFFPSEHSVSVIARVAGIFFISAGALLALSNLSSIDEYKLQQATVLDAIGVNATQTEGTTLTGSNANYTVPDTKPVARIFIDGFTTLSPVKISDIVPVIVTVPGALEVNLILENITSGQLVPLGTISKGVDATTWRYNFDTKVFSNGEYKLRAVIRNQYSSYEQLGDISYSISNQAVVMQSPAVVARAVASSSSLVKIDTASSTASNINSIDPLPKATSSVPVPPENIPVAVVPAPHIVSFNALSSSKVHGTVPLSIFSIGASEMSVYAKNLNAHIDYFVGSAIPKNNDSWEVLWNTEKVPDGRYTLFANGKFDTSTITSEPIETSVYNAIDIASSTPTASSTEVNQIQAPLSELKPVIALSLSKSGLLSGKVDLTVETTPVLWVELYAVSKTSLSPYFLGLAQRNSDTTWKYTWDTNQTPNKDYYIYARVKTEYGFVESGRISATILNDNSVSLTSEQEKAITLMYGASDALVKTTADANSTSSIAEEGYHAVKVVYVQPVQKFIENFDASESTKVEVKKLLLEFNIELNKRLELYAKAVRGGDTTESQKILTGIEVLRKEVIAKLPNNNEETKINERINSYLTQLVSELEDLTHKNEDILKDRLGVVLTKDSDNDGVSDYDEINIYHTNPFSADTDGDGYIDSVEIQLGFNPNDSNSESLVTYESPQDTGIVRDDILKVKSVTTLSYDSESKKESTPVRAIISGEGLPGSFVTLYVYSTPIVITVKTDDNGNWSYIFDKEIENGNHEIYVGMTDNTGRIIAKSSPLPFVKTAEAFTNADASVAISPVYEPSLIQGNAMLLVASIGVVALGLVLLLLGLHVHKEKEELFQPAIS